MKNKMIQTMKNIVVSSIMKTMIMILLLFAAVSTWYVFLFVGTSNSYFDEIGTGVGLGTFALLIIRDYFMFEKNELLSNEKESSK